MSPVEDLIVPSGASVSSEGWKLMAQNSRVNKSWQAMMDKAPENALWCFEWLHLHPMKRLPGRVYPLKRKQYRGSWAFEITGGDRVYYTPKPQEKTVLIFYAGGHPPKIPYPPEVL